MIRQVLRRPRGELRVDLVGVDHAVRTGEPGEQGGVVAGARSDVDGRLAGVYGEGREAGGVQGRLAVVDLLLPLDGDREVLVQERRIVVGRLDVARAGEDVPWPRAHEARSEEHTSELQSH